MAFIVLLLQNHIKAFSLAVNIPLYLQPKTLQHLGSSWEAGGEMDKK